MSEYIESEKCFNSDAKILIDIQTIADRYGSYKDMNFCITSVGRDFIDFSFRFGTILFSDGWDLALIKRCIKNMGYEYLHCLIHSNGVREPIHLTIRMRVSSKQRKIKDLFKWIYYIPRRIYWRYKYWRNYGTWRYR